MKILKPFRRILTIAAVQLSFGAEQLQNLKTAIRAASVEAARQSPCDQDLLPASVETGSVSCFLLIQEFLFLALLKECTHAFLLIVGLKACAEEVLLDHDGIIHADL